MKHPAARSVGGVRKLGGRDIFFKNNTKVLHGIATGITFVLQRCGNDPSS